MVTSLRFGPNPHDLQLADPASREFKAAKQETRDFAIVRVRLGGRWVLAVLREWRRSPSAVYVRLEASLPDSDDLKTLWYVFASESVDPVTISPATGSLHLIPPEQRLRQEPRANG